MLHDYESHASSLDAEIAAALLGHGERRRRRAATIAVPTLEGLRPPRLPLRTPRLNVGHRADGRRAERQVRGCVALRRRRRRDPLLRRCEIGSERADRHRRGRLVVVVVGNAVQLTERARLRPGSNAPALPPAGRAAATNRRDHATALEAAAAAPWPAADLVAPAPAAGSLRASDPARNTATIRICDHDKDDGHNNGNTCC